MNSADSNNIERLCTAVRVIPVLVIDHLNDALPLASALLTGGLRVLEVTLRTPVAMAAVREITSALPAACVGVGSVIEPEQFAAAARAGARFAVSPGSTVKLQAAAQAQELTWLPGAQTASEILELRSKGVRFIKFFPADSAGGSAFLRGIAGPVPDVRFCPTGGISAANAGEYLSLPNVVCVGGSWVTPSKLIRQKCWSEITALARQARQLGGAK